VGKTSAFVPRLIAKKKNDRAKFDKRKKDGPEDENEMRRKKVIRTGHAELGK